jgi:hypothetical protein
MRQCNSPEPKLEAVVDPGSGSVQELAHEDRPWSALGSVKAGEAASSTLGRGLTDTSSFDRVRSTSSSNCDIQALIEFKSLIMEPLDAVYCTFMQVGACDCSNNPVNANISIGQVSSAVLDKRTCISPFLERLLSNRPMRKVASNFRLV